MPNDNVHFQRFRYPTKEEEPSGGTKVLAFMEVEFPDRSTQRLYSFLARFEIGNLQHESGQTVSLPRNTIDVRSYSLSRRRDFLE